MKVFTVGLDQKPPLEEAKGSPEKSDTPPPGYSTTEARIPLPLGPQLPRPPLPPQPIIMRKARGYKGILLVLIAVFLMAAFALTLSEMAYNRQREENFFKLRWAELKHRMGYENAGPYDYYHRASSAIGEKFDRLFSLAKSNELPPSLPISASMDRDPSTTSTTSAPAQPSEPVVAIDSFPQFMGLNGRRVQQPFGPQQNSVEVEQPMPQMFGSNGMTNSGPFSQVRDARLQFLRNILQKIKQHAEDIGFDGTMQVSIIEVEPQNGADGAETAAQENGNINNNNNIWGPQQRGVEMGQPQQQQQHSLPAQMAFPMPQHFFPHPRPLIDDFKNSRSFLDGFGEFHPPSFVQQQQQQMNNHITEPEERPRMFGPWAQQQQMPNMPDEFQQQQQQQQQQQPNVPDFRENMRWPHINPFRQSPEMLFFHPIFPQQMNLRFPPIQPPQVNNEWAQQQQQNALQPQQNGAAALPRPAAFDRWNGGPPQASSNNGFFVPPPPPPQFAQQQQQEQTEQQQQPQPQQSVVQQQQQPQPQPQQQQIQIDFPEVKLPPPSIDSNDNSNNVVDDNNKNKFQLPIGPPTEQPQAQNQQQPQQPRQDWLPKWSTSSSSSAADKTDPDNSKDDDDNDDDENSNANRGTGTMFGAGPPSAQPSDIVKFPTVTVVEAAKNEHDDAVEPIPTSLGTEQPAAPPAQPTPAAAAPQVQAAGAAVAPSQTEHQQEKKEQSADELVEVDAPPQPIVPQQNSQPAQPQQQQPQQQQQEEMTKTEQEQPQLNQQQQPSPPGISPFQQKWFPEVPSVFFQKDNSREEIEKTEKVFESMVQNMKRMIGKMFKVDDSDSTEIVQVDDPNGGTAGGTDDVNMPKPAELVANDGGAGEQQRPRQPHMVVD
ncbi:hypothetical protein niasHS_007923 [Heterodera schachtii]|uniref:Uncharacterized protein n=1 Tax=Heterodera schachtii TaxID=97005 RepID=A0ABD2JQ28_HETSC